MEFPFESLASVYDQWFEEKGKIIFQIETLAFREILGEFPRPWVEVGVGSGRFSQALGIPFGLDPAMNILKIAQGRGLSVVRATGERVPLKTRSVGTVFLIVTLCFVKSPVRVLQEARRLLKGNGRVVLGLVLREYP